MKKQPAQILLINPNLMKPPVSPIAIDFLASRLRTEGYGVTFLDLAFEPDINAALERTLTWDPLFVGITVRNIDDLFFASRDFCLEKMKPKLQRPLGTCRSYSFRRTGRSACCSELENKMRPTHDSLTRR